MSPLRTATTLVTALALVAACSDDPVQPPEPTLTLTVTPTALTIGQATVDEVAITARLEDSIEEVTFGLTGGDESVTGQIVDIDVDGLTTTAKLRITVLGDADPGEYTFMIIASSDAVEDDESQIITVTVPPPGGGGDIRQ
jgi:hypothetical protein